MKNTEYQYTLNLNDSEAVETGLTGGKGANLARLYQGNFNVPEARIICQSAYREWIGQYQGSLVFDPDTVANPNALVEQCNLIKEKLSQLPLPEALIKQLRYELKSIACSKAVSVRSSATLEDLPGAAFAGQHETYLGVSGIDAILEGIKGCYLSLWDQRAVRYRLENGFGVNDAGMAVVVQKMVAAEKAGVAFSVHPISGNARHTLINANFGLGETVVSGECEIDQYTVADSVCVIEKRIGKKSRRLVLDGTATEEADLPESMRQRESLLDEQAVSIAQLAQAAEKHFGSPQDIEWAIDADQLFVLQSRPITELPEHWTRQESAERFPSPITPLTWDFTIGGFNSSLQHSFDLLGLPRLKGRWFERFDGFIYGNQTAVDQYTSGQSLQFKSIEEFVALTDRLAPAVNTVKELPADWNVNLERFITRLNNLQGVDLEQADISEIGNHLTTLKKIGDEYFQPNIAISIAHGLLHKA